MKTIASFCESKREKQATRKQARKQATSDKSKQQKV
jgi:hypothetical protein